jgi:pimeloyl-ACP methyl ester carboxylesterase
MCSGVRGLSDHHFDRVHKLFESEGNPNGFIDLIDYDGIKIYDKIQQHLRRQIVIDTIDELAEKGYDNILLSGLSAGGFLSFYLTAHFPDKIDGSIIFNPAAYGGKLGKNSAPRQVLRDYWEKEMSKGKIFYLTRTFYPYQFAGGPLMRAATVGFLKKMGWEVEVIMPNYETNEIIEENEVVQIPFPNNKWARRWQYLLERIGYWEDYF